jgi:hypothetical protein
MNNQAINSTEITKKQIQEKLDKQYLLDLSKIMSTDYGRRVISYLIQDCGYKDSIPNGNSKDFFNAGRRAVAVGLIKACDALGMDSQNRMLGVDLRLQAEREYIICQMNVLKEIELARTVTRKS